MVFGWTRRDIPDLTGRRAVVTGANSGLGFETTKALAAAGAEVVMACRNTTKAADARRRIVDDLGGSASGSAGPVADRITIEEVDLAVLGSVAQAVDRLRDRFDRLDLLINNAGVMMTPPQLTEDGIEFQFACNHTGHFALTAGLLPLLEAPPAARVVALSSLAANSGSLIDHDPTSLDDYLPFGVYATTKLANQVFAVEFDRRLRAAGSSVSSVAAHPGLSATGLFDAVPLPGPLAWGAGLGAKLVTQPASIGALPTLRAAVDPDVESGTYWGPAIPGQAYGPPKQISILRHAAVPETGARLWTMSEDLTGVEFAV